MLAVQYGQELLEKNNLLQHEMGTLASEYQETLISYSAQQQKLSKLEQEIETLKATASITAGTTGTTTTLVQSMTISPQPSSLLDICSKCSLSMSSSSSSPLPLSFSNGVSVGTSPEENVGGIHLRSDNVATGLDDITVNLTLSKIHTIPNDSVMQKRFDASNLAAIESLEKTVHCLQLQLENTTEELTQAIETNRNTERYARKLEEDLETIRVDTEVN